MHRLSPLVTVVAGAVAVSAIILGSIPPPPARAPVMTRSQLLPLVSRLYSQSASEHEYARLGVQFHRIISSRQWRSVMTACIAETGIPGVTPGYAGSWIARTSDASTALVQHDIIEACSLQFPLAADVEELHTRQQWLYQYAYLSHDFVPCLRAHGVAVPPLVARAEFLRAAQSGRVVDAYVTLALDVHTPRGASIHSACPSRAPGF
ncbi:hypothetical protein [Galbitalea soli]|uniref:Uncharacterized protein n=1 Tax=Galbitalea soli TaxID=1268042 RepID=A0A7C9PLW3_9MICO|nr:hypothetical protein [Galbitalea soli]NEM90367.1 hypothetical protein [Galbitalea soli]NYJ31077.1 hypothetical protein [Galbitalea soli]